MAQVFSLVSDRFQVRTPYFPAQCCHFPQPHVRGDDGKCSTNLISTCNFFLKENMKSSSNTLLTSKVELAHGKYLPKREKEKQSLTNDSEELQVNRFLAGKVKILF